jgi:tetratricopeptide (TPR) repeat protein
VLVVTRGFTAPEMRAAAERASDLAEKSGNLAQLVVQVFGIWRSLFFSGNYSAGVLLGERILDLAKREGSPASFGFAYHAQLVVSFFGGDLAGAEEHFTRWSGFVDAPGFRQVHGAAVVTISRASLCAAALGRPDIARERIAQAITFARESNNLYDLAVARVFESRLYGWLREPQRAEVAATQALAIAEEHDFPAPTNMTRTTLGWARAQLGRADEGSALIRQGLAGLVEVGIRLNVTEHLTRLAEAQALDGKNGDALDTIEEALQANPEELYFRPETLRIRGDLRLELGQTQLAEADFREGIALAQTMSAKAWELRTATSLARLLDKQGQRDEARAMLTGIYNWFTEGFDTADLKDAKALLDGLEPA